VADGESRVGYQALYKTLRAKAWQPIPAKVPAQIVDVELNLAESKT